MEAETYRSTRNILVAAACGVAALAGAVAVTRSSEANHPVIRGVHIPQNIKQPLVWEKKGQPQLDIEALNEYERVTLACGTVHGEPLVETSWETEDGREGASCIYTKGNEYGDKQAVLHQMSQLASQHGIR